MKYSIIAAIAILLFLGLSHIPATALTITTNTNWSAITTGSGPGGQPNASDPINVKNNAILTVDVSNALGAYVDLGLGGGSAGTGTLRFNAGSQLDISAGAGTLGLGANASYNGLLDMTAGGKIILKSIYGSNASFNPGAGTIEFKASNTLLSGFSTYNNVIVNGAGITITQTTGITCTGYLTVTAGTLTTTASNYALTVNGVTTIASGATLNVNGSNVAFKGNFSNSGTFTYGTSTVTLNGAAAQVMGGANATTFNNLTINNTAATLSAATITLANDINVNGTLTFTRGYLLTSATDILTMAAGSSASGASISSYVNGPMLKAGTTAFVFPIGYGNGTKFGRLAISAPATATTFSAQYYGVPYSNVTSMAASPSPTLLNVSRVEYWELNRTSGSENVRITLYWEDAYVSGVSDCSYLRVAYWNSGLSQWQNNNESSSVTGLCSGNNSGTVVTSTAVTAFGIFTFGNRTGGINPLPIELLYFNATCNNGKVNIDWSTASQTNNDYFTIQRTTDGVDFKTLGTVKGENGIKTLNYGFTDNEPLSTTSYYRLKQTDFDGKYTYFNLVPAFCNSGILFNIYPNPSNGKFTIASEALHTGLLIVNALGEKIAAQEISSAQTEVDLSNLPAGIYYARLYSNVGSSVRKFSIVK